jgi:hypothetical protein
LQPYFQSDYFGRFDHRVDNMRNALDQLGKDSTNLDLLLGYRTTMGQPFLRDGVDSNFVCAVATEIQTLANGLK